MELRRLLPVDVRVRLRRCKQGAERAVARMRFALEGRVSERTLSSDDIAAYRRDGFLLVRDLVPAQALERARAATWELTGARPDDRGTWRRLGPEPRTLRDERLLALYVPRLLAAAAELSGFQVSGFARPHHAFTMHRPPGSGPWKIHGAHLDYSLPELRHRTFPRPFRIGVMLYLTDVSERGGATHVWRGSHVRVEALARSDRRRLALMATLNDELGRLDLGEPVATLPQAGDVIFLHPFCAHASSENVSATPRLALNHKW